MGNYYSMLKIKKSSEVPWEKVFHRANWYTIYEYGNSFIFVPRERHIGGLISAFEGACKLASVADDLGADGFEIIHKTGTIGQAVDWPYIEMIRVRKNHE
jgi:hypothetical protein